MTLKNHGPGGCCCVVEPPPCWCYDIIDYNCKCLSTDHGTPTPLGAAVISLAGSCLAKPLRLGSSDGMPGFPYVVSGDVVECAPFDDLCDCSDFDGMTVECSTEDEILSGHGYTFYCKYVYVCTSDRLELVEGVLASTGDQDYYYVVVWRLNYRIVQVGENCYHRVEVFGGSWMIRVPAGTTVSSEVGILYPDGSTVNGGCPLIPVWATFTAGGVFLSPSACKVGWTANIGDTCTEECNGETQVVACYSGSLSGTPYSPLIADYNGCDLSGLTIGVSL